MFIALIYMQNSGNKKQSELKFRSLDTYCDIQIISFISLTVGDTTIFWGGSLVTIQREHV